MYLKSLDSYGHMIWKIIWRKLRCLKSLDTCGHVFIWKDIGLKNYRCISNYWHMQTHESKMIWKNLGVSNSWTHVHMKKNWLEKYLMYLKSLDTCRHMNSKMIWKKLRCLKSLDRCEHMFIWKEIGLKNDWCISNCWTHADT